MTMNDHWGYNKTDKNFKSVRELIRTLTDVASKGGNYLLNVGPTADGLFPQESIDRLAAIGEWMAVNGEAIYGTQASPFRQLDWGRCTRKQSVSGTTLYLHIFEWPADSMLVLPGVLNEPLNASLLADPGRETLKITRKEDALEVRLPALAPDTVNTVIALELKGPLDMTEPPVFLNDPDIFIDTAMVILHSDRENVEIRYEKRRAEPTALSPIYTGPVLIKGTTVISARCFRGGKPVSGTISREYKKVAPLDPVRVIDPDGVGHPDRVGLRYRYYEGDWDSLPDFEKLKPVKEGIVPDFVFTPRNQEERFAFVYESLVQIPATEVYTFFTDSDDGSRLWIDDRLVVDNDGLHGMQLKQGDIPLARGYHRIRVAFFEKTGSDALTVYVTSPGSKKKIIPKEWFFIY